MADNKLPKWFKANPNGTEAQILCPTVEESITVRLLFVDTLTKMSQISARLERLQETIGKGSPAPAEGDEAAADAAEVDEAAADAAEVDKINAVFDDLADLFYQAEVTLNLTATRGVEDVCTRGERMPQFADVKAENRGKLLRAIPWKWIQRTMEGMQELTGN